MTATRHILSPEAATSALTLALEVFARWQAGGEVRLDQSGIMVDGIPIFGDPSSPSRPRDGDQPVVAARLPNIFQFDGKKCWIFQYDGKRIVQTKKLGFQHIRMLLETPYAGVDCKVLAGAINCHKFNCVEPGLGPEEDNDEGFKSSPRIKAADSTPVDQMVDQTTLQQVRNRLKTVQAELASHQESDNQVAVREAEVEIKDLQKFLMDNCHRKRSKSFDGPANKIRKKVWVAIDRAIESIAQDHPALAQHLKHSIKTGFSCCYVPEKQTEWIL